MNHHPKKRIKVGLVQHACISDKDTNLANSIAGVRKAAIQSAKLILLQELHASPYFCVTQNTDQFDLAETIPGPITEQLSSLAAELDIVLVASLFEKRAAGLYHNTATVFDGRHGLVGCYRKMHIPDDPGYNEKFYFTPGDLGFTPIQTSIGKLGVLVCWDQWFPEAARIMALKGAELLLYPTAIGWDPNDEIAIQTRQLDAWITIQRAHAIANGLPVISCNRVGLESDPSGHTSGNCFWGHSFICGSQGEMLLQLGEKEAIGVAEIDLEQSEAIRRMWPYLRDRRIDAYAPLLKRFHDN